LDRRVFVFGKSTQLSAVRTSLQQANDLLRANAVGDAVELLEETARDEPNNPQVTFALGAAYLRVPDENKATAEFQKLLAAKPSTDTLNSIAYSYAKANVRLSEALDYISRAVAETSSETVNASSEWSDPKDFFRSATLAAEWDTLGYVKFRSGDAVAAEQYIHAAWMRWAAGRHRQTPGGGLREAGEKQRSRANRRAGSSIDRAGRRTRYPQSSGVRQEALWHEYIEALPRRRFPGQRPGFFASSGLADLRTLNVPRTIAAGGKSKIALITVALENGNTEAHVRLVSGDKEPRAELPALTGLNYGKVFPDTTRAKIMRAGYLSCSQYLPKCSVVFFVADDRQSFNLRRGQAP
jgi:hypothetical protein